MATTTLPGETFPLAQDLTVTRMWYGATQPASPGVFGAPGDRGAAGAVPREVIERGFTSLGDQSGPHDK